MEHWFENTRMGQRVRLIEVPGENGGRRFVMEVVTRPFAGEFAVPPHVHPAYAETFDILAGRARYRLGGEERAAGPGDRIVMPAGVPHVHPWSDGDEELRVLQTADADPPDRRGLEASLQAAITIFGLAREGRVNDRGAPNILRLAVLVDASIPATYLAGPPRLVQRLAFRALGTIGRALGYRTSYPEYGVVTARGVEFARG